jgi:hypothetical protein
LLKGTRIYGIALQYAVESSDPGGELHEKEKNANKAVVA